MNIINLTVLLTLINQGKALDLLLKIKSTKSTTTQLRKNFYKPEEIAHQFQLFRIKYKKTYRNSHEFERALKNFKDNISDCTRRNIRSESAIFDVSPYFDLSPDEIVAKMNNTFKAKLRKFDAKSIDSSEEVKLRVKAFDWQKSNLVSAVRDQGQCKCSWAIAVAGAVETKYAIQHTFMRITSRMSVQQLLDCTPNADCEGGHPNQALEYAFRFGGLIAEKRYPFKGTKSRCHAKRNSIKIKVLGGRSFLDVEEHLASLIYRKGPVIATLRLGHGFMFYKGGIATEDDFDCDKGRITHTVLITGYGFDNGTGLKFWNMKNSFGVDWGERGYFRLQRGKNACKLTEQIIEPLVE